MKNILIAALLAASFAGAQTPTPQPSAFCMSRSGMSILFGTLSAGMNPFCEVLVSVDSTMSGYRVTLNYTVNGETRTVTQDAPVTQGKWASMAVVFALEPDTLISWSVVPYRLIQQ